MRERERNGRDGRSVARLASTRQEGRYVYIQTNETKRVSIDFERTNACTKKKGRDETRKENSLRQKLVHSKHMHLGHLEHGLKGIVAEDVAFVACVLKCVRRGGEGRVG